MTKGVRGDRIRRAYEKPGFFTSRAHPTPPGRPRLTNLAQEFAALHVPGWLFLLVNAWDVYLALALADAGHPAIGTTSSGTTAAAGILPVPVTADLDDGYDTVPGRVADLVAHLAAAGVAGVNLEDGHRSAADHAKVIAAVKAAAPNVFVNARTRSMCATVSICVPSAFESYARKHPTWCDG